jgi:MFS family permease
VQRTALGTSDPTGLGDLLRLSTLGECVQANARPSRLSLRGLDWFAFFVADNQTGWGPFVAAYLTSVAWTHLDIALVFTIGTLAAFALQIPAGALVDSIPAKRFLVALAVTCISESALLLALWPTFGVVIVAKVLHAIASIGRPSGRCSVSSYCFAGGSTSTDASCWPWMGRGSRW